MGSSGVEPISSQPNDDDDVIDHANKTILSKNKNNEQGSFDNMMNSASSILRDVGIPVSMVRDSQARLSLTPVHHQISLSRQNTTTTTNNKNLFAPHMMHPAEEKSSPSKVMTPAAKAAGHHHQQDAPPPTTPPAAGGYAGGTRPQQERKFTQREEECFCDFRDEISLLKNLDHPAICKLHEVYEDACALYLVLELCQGGELLEKIEECDVLEESRAVSVVSQVAQGLA